MKRLKYLLILSLALLAASCSKDDALAPGTDDTPGGDLQEFTFTVGVDYTLTGEDGTTTSTANSIATRATAIEDDAPTRCFMEVFNVADWEHPDLPGVQAGVKNVDGTFTFTAKLRFDNTYKFCFYADNGDGEITSLKAVPYTIGTVAFATTEIGRPETVRTAVTLEHVVAKVTLATTAATTIAAGKEASLATLCATEYNALKDAVTKSAEQTYTASVSGSYGPDDKAGVVSCYVIPAAEKQDITIGCHLLTQTIADVPLAPNTHVTLRGDLSENNENWQVTDEYIENKMDEYFFDDGGNPIGNKISATEERYLYGTIEDVNKFFQKITRNPDFSLNSGGRIWVIGSGYGDEQWLIISSNLTININWHSASYNFTWHVWDDSSCPSFPTID